ncbi:uncharacterized protein [Halyomorpha halys]|uniref:uncharacterized protein n=1 Tax=Halyomorpha halys TaxID=286706 RepID=UPI0006D4ECEE|nr:uncharacterized protein LOC106682922 [Halyomorpha halys]
MALPHGMDWSNEKTLYFIELYEKKTVLWDPKHPEHKNRMKLSEAWVDIQRVFDPSIPITELKKKKESLMSSYRPLRRKVMESESNADEADDVFKPCWYAYEAIDRFMRSRGERESWINSVMLCDSPISEDTIQVRGNLSTDCEETSNTQDSDVTFNLHAEPVVVISHETNRLKKDNDVSFNLPAEPVIVISNERNQLKKSVSKQKRVIQAIEELKELHKITKKDQSVAISSINNSETQFDIYGKSVAAQLKTLPFGRAIMAQSQIQDVLSQHAMEYYREKNSINP